jgi:hypothetical protein
MTPEQKAGVISHHQSVQKYCGFDSVKINTNLYEYALHIPQSQSAREVISIMLTSIIIKSLSPSIPPPSVSLPIYTYRE